MSYRYIDAPRHAEIRDRNYGGPSADVAITDSGAFAVITDPATPPDLLGHALDYADRLAELGGVPAPRAPLQAQRPAPAPAAVRHALTPGRTIALLLLSSVASLVLTACSDTNADRPFGPVPVQRTDDDEPHENL